MRILFPFLLLLGYAQFAQATLNERDLTPNTGDKKLTYDTQSGLEWLDVTLTQGRSFSEVKNDWGGWLSRGFRVAYIAEVDGLITSANLMPNTLYDTYAGTGSESNVLAVKDLVTKVGITFIYEDEGSPYQRRSTYGYVADAYSNSPGYENFGRYADIGFYERGWTTFAWAYDGSHTQVHTDSQYSNLGTFLVRDAQVSAVPEPSAYLLLLAGLGVLGLARRNDSRNSVSERKLAFPAV